MLKTTKGFVAVDPNSIETDRTTHSPVKGFVTTDRLSRLGVKASVLLPSMNGHQPGKTVYLSAEVYEIPRNIIKLNGKEVWIIEERYILAAEVDSES